MLDCDFVLLLLTDEARRPWRRNRGLSEGDFQSEVRAWGANEVTAISQLGLWLS